MLVPVALAIVATASAPRLVSGLVIDDRRAPIAGAQIVAIWSREQPPLRTKSAADGRFELDLPSASTVTLVATSADGRLGAITAIAQSPPWGQEDQLRLPVLLHVDRGSSLEVEVRDASGVVPGATIELQPACGGCPISVSRTDEQGRARIDPAPAMDGLLVAFKDGAGVGRVAIGIEPEQPARTSVELRPCRRLSVSVNDGDTGEPVSAAVVTIERVAETSAVAGHEPGAAADPRCTDARGIAVFTDLVPGSRLRVRADAESFLTPVERNDVPPGIAPPLRILGSREVAADAVEVHLQLRRRVQRLVRWRILPNELPVPADETPVTIRGDQLREWTAFASEWRGVVRGGAIECVVETDPEVEEAPIASALAETSDGSLAILRPPPYEPEKPRRREGFATLVRGAALEVRLLAAGGSARPNAGIGLQLVRSPEHDLPGATRWSTTDERGTVRWSPLPEGHYRVSADGVSRIVDLGNGNVRCDLGPPRQRSVVVELTYRGERRLPRDLEIFSASECRFLRREDPVRGDVHLSLASQPPDVELSIQVWSEHGSAERSFVMPPGDDEIHLPIELDRAAPPITTTAPRDERSFARVEVVWKVPDGENTDFLSLDLPGSSEDLPWYWPTWDGTWPLVESPPLRELRFDRDNPPPLRVRHPYLVGTRVNDSIRLDLPREAITLHVAAGPVVSIATELPRDVRPTRGAFVTLAVGGNAAVSTATSAPLRALLRDSALVFAPPSAGTRSVLIDPVVVAPAELQGVVFSGGAQDLGRVSFRRGSALRVHARVRPPFVPPVVQARAIRLDGIRYERASPSEPEAILPGEAIVRALGPGRFAVSFFDGVDRWWSREVTLDGEHDADLTIDVD
jgi:hypothetical protein